MQACSFRIAFVDFWGCNFRGCIGRFVTFYHLLVSCVHLMAWLMGQLSVNFFRNRAWNLEGGRRANRRTGHQDRLFSSRASWESLHWSVQSSHSSPLFKSSNTPSNRDSRSERSCESSSLWPEAIYSSQACGLILPNDSIHSSNLSKIVRICVITHRCVRNTRVL